MNDAFCPDKQWHRLEFTKEFQPIGQKNTSRGLSNVYRHHWTCTKCGARGHWDGSIPVAIDREERKGR